MIDSDAKQRNLDDLCRALAANTPDLTTVRWNWDSLPRMCNEAAVQLGEALRDNTVVTSIRLPVRPSVTIAGAQDIAQFIAHSPSLRTISLCDNDQRVLSMPVVDLLLTAAGVSGRIEGLHLECCRFGNPAFAGSMLGMRNSLKDLSLSFPALMNDELVDIVANAIRGLPSLEKLSMGDASADSHRAAAVINRGVVGHPSLQVLYVSLQSETGSGALCSGAVRNLLLSPTPLQELSLDYEDCYDTSLNFVNHGLTGLFVDVAGHQTLRDLALIWKNSLGGRIGIQGAMCIATLLKTNRTIEIFQCDCCCLRGVVAVLESLVGTDANLTLKELTLWSRECDGDEELCDCEGEGFFERLVTLVPLLNHLEKLALRDFKSPFRPEQTIDVVRAFERNTSLTSVDIHYLLDTTEQREAVQYYATRNKYLPVLAEASVAKMVLFDFAGLQTDHDELTSLSLMLETLRSRDDWAGPPSSSTAMKHHRRNKKRRLETHA